MGCHCLLQGIFLTQGIEPRSPAFPASASGFFTTAPPGKPLSLGQGELITKMGRMHPEGVCEPCMPLRGDRAEGEVGNRWLASGCCRAL